MRSANDGTKRSRANFGEAFKNVHVTIRMIFGGCRVDLVIADDYAVRLTTRRAKFVLIDFLKQSALIPFFARVREVAAELFPRDRQHADFGARIGRAGCLIDNVLNASPRGFELLKTWVM